jgi:hypothetical protein
MNLQAFYVLISRVTSLQGLRLLQYNEDGLDSVQRQMPDQYLHAWEHAYNENGIWSDELAMTALRSIRSSRTILVEQAAAKVTQASSSNLNTPVKVPLPLTLTTQTVTLTQTLQGTEDYCNRFKPTQTNYFI